MSDLHAITEEFLKLLGDDSVSYEPHDPRNKEDSDMVWIIEYDDGGMCAGEYISLEPSTADTWFVSHNSADEVGGHPTYWFKSGTASELLSELASLFVERRAELNINE